jgi:hypothetical protein
MMGQVNACLKGMQITYKLSRQTGGILVDMRLKDKSAWSIVPSEADSLAYLGEVVCELVAEVNGGRVQ